MISTCVLDIFRRELLSPMVSSNVWFVCMCVCLHVHACVCECEHVHVYVVGMCMYARSAYHAFFPVSIATELYWRVSRLRAMMSLSRLNLHFPEED